MFIFLCNKAFKTFRWKLFFLLNHLNLTYKNIKQINTIKPFDFALFCFTQKANAIYRQRENRLKHENKTSLRNHERPYWMEFYFLVKQTKKTRRNIRNSLRCEKVIKLQRNTFVCKQLVCFLALVNSIYNLLGRNFNCVSIATYFKPIYFTIFYVSL